MSYYIYIILYDLSSVLHSDRRLQRPHVGLHYSLSGQTLPKEEQKQWRSAKFETMCSAKALDSEGLSSSSLAKIYPAERVRWKS